MYLILKMFGGLPEKGMGFKSIKKMNTEMKKIARKEKAEWNKDYLRSTLDADIEYYTIKIRINK